VAFAGGDECREAADRRAVIACLMIRAIHFLPMQIGCLGQGPSQEKTCLLFHILPLRAFGCNAAWNLGPNTIVNAPRGGQHFSIATCRTLSSKSIKDINWQFEKKKAITDRNAIQKALSLR
jgi:hypothetical protein